LHWEPVAGAANYFVRIFRQASPRPLLELRTSYPLAELPARWVGGDGERRRFMPGRYRWEVFALSDSSSLPEPDERPARTGTFTLQPSR
jgi:hypothetical protein